MPSNEQEKLDVVNSPPHYTSGNIECIEAIEAAGYGVEFCAGNAMKYLWRFRHKENALQDAKKCLWYVQRLVKQLEQADSGQIELAEAIREEWRQAQ